MKDLRDAMVKQVENETVAAINDGLARGITVSRALQLKKENHYNRQIGAWLGAVVFVLRLTLCGLNAR